MENKNEKFRLRLNLFDGIVLVLAILVGGILVWNRLKPSDPGTETDMSSTLEYVVRFQQWPVGDSRMIQVGDELTDNVKNLDLGTVKAVEVVPATTETYSEKDEKYIRAEVPDCEDVLVTVESSPASMNEKDGRIMLDGGVHLRVGETMHIRGAGYMASGPVVYIERTEEGAK